jgi:hypothetical protein
VQEGDGDPPNEGLAVALSLTDGQIGVRLGDSIAEAAAVTDRQEARPLPLPSQPLATSDSDSDWGSHDEVCLEPGRRFSSCGSGTTPTMV